MSRCNNLVACLFFVLLSSSIVTAKDCDKSKCQGPLRYYDELKCKPIYDESDDCCAVAYDCAHLETRTTNECHVNGNKYKIGASLKEQDASGPCDVACFCTMGPNNIAMFSCAAVDCPERRFKEGCFFRPQLDSCCGGDLVCPNELEVIEGCELLNTTYKYGEVFYPDNERICQCSKTYTMGDLEIICRKLSCGIELRRGREIKMNCPPVYYRDLSPTNTCSFEYRCQTNEDRVIPSKNPRHAEANGTSNMKCKFGNMTLDIGDELNQETKYNFGRVRCVCEVPPTLTCRNVA